MGLVFRTIRSLIYIPLFLWLFVWLSLEARVYDIHFGQLKNWLQPAGIAIMIAGSLLLLYCIAIFITRGRGTPAVFDAPVKFVITGPYRIVRNPMYTGFFIFMAGFALLHQSVAMLILTLLVILFFHLFVLFYEEPALTKKFGEDYLNYKRKVGRWFP